MKNANSDNIALNLSEKELTHIRDLFSVLLPQEFKITLSESLAITSNNQKTENVLWKKIYNLCKTNNIPTDKDASDFAILPLSQPELGIQQVILEIEKNETT
jgi:hypothetical protein